MRNRYCTGFRHRADLTARRDVAGAAATPDRPGCPQRGGELCGTGRDGWPPLPGGSAAPQPPAGQPAVAPLHGLLQADMMVVASASLPSGTRARIRELPGVTA